MKIKVLSTALVATAMVLVGCDKGGKNPNPPTPPVVFNNFEEAVSSILTKHNYSAHLLNQWDAESTPWFECNIYNINDNAIYDDIGDLEWGIKYYSGYIKQKDQGIVTFYAFPNDSEIETGGFAATNLDRTVSDVYSYAPDHIVDKGFTYSEERQKYVCDDFDAIAVLANLAFGEYVSLVSAPEDLTGEFKDNKVVISGLYELTFYDEEVIHVNADVSITFSNIETTSNKPIEDYVAHPTKQYTVPTAWDKGIKDLFDEYYNGYYPPFMSGLSYSWKYGKSYSEGSNAIMLEDYCNGDLTGNYITALVSDGFVPVQNPGFIEYMKTVVDDNFTHKYSVKMKFYAPTDTDASGMEYRYLFPNGVTSVKFLYKKQAKEEITTVGLLNEYINNTVAGWFIPAFNLPDSTRVSKFKDATGTLESTVLLLKGTNSDYFNIYPETKEQAISFVNQLKTYLESKGFSSTGTFLGQYWYSDDYSSAFRFTDPESISTWTSSSYLQMRIEITQDTLDANDHGDVFMDHLTVTGQTTSFTVGDTFEFDGTVTLTYTDDNSKEVVPTEVIGPDMSVAGQQSVTIKYSEDGDTVSTTYTVTVNPSETKYVINTSCLEGTSITISMPSAPEQGQYKTSAGLEVQFSVSYTDEQPSVKVMCGEDEVKVNGPNQITGIYQFTMPLGDVTIYTFETPVVHEHNISYVIKNSSTGETISFASVIHPSSVMPIKFTDNSAVNFEINTTSDYNFVSATIGDASYTSSSFSYNALDSDFVVTIFVSPVGGGDTPSEFGGSYAVDNGAYNTYIITFNDDGTGTYVRDVHNSSPATYTATFSYVKVGNAITITLTGFVETGTDNTSFQSGYRLFPSTDIGAKNTTCIMAEDNNSLTIDLYSSSTSTTPRNYTFTK